MNNKVENQLKSSFAGAIPARGWIKVSDGDDFRVFNLNNLCYAKKRTLKYYMRAHPTNSILLVFGKDSVEEVDQELNPDEYSFILEWLGKKLN